MRFRNPDATNFWQSRSFLSINYWILLEQHLDVSEVILHSFNESIEINIFRMTISLVFRFTLLFITTLTRASTKYMPRSVNGSAVCAVGPVLGLKLRANLRGSCVPLSVRCTFTCQQNHKCIGFNYYTKGCCEFFSGSIVNVTNQQGCTFWAVGLLE